MKTLLKSVHIYQSYCKKNLAQFFWPTLYMQVQNFLEITHTHADTECLSSMQAAIHNLLNRARGGTLLCTRGPCPLVPLASYGPGHASQCFILSTFGQCAIILHTRYKLKTKNRKNTKYIFFGNFFSNSFGSTN